jgi:NADPH:quinone reductase-like Zn-dependent oxidoreductase
VPVPCPADTQLVFEVQAVAPNLSDLKEIGFIVLDGAVPECDYAGVVNKVSASCPCSFKAGDRAAGVIHGGLYADRGNSWQYLAVECNTREATTFPVFAVTAIQRLNSNLGVPWPKS